MTNNDTRTQPDAPATTRFPRWPLWARVLLAPLIMLIAALSPLLPQSPLYFFPDAAKWLNDPANAVGSAPLLLTLAFPTLAALFLVWLAMTRLQGRPLRDAGALWTRASFGLLGVGLALSFAVTFATALPFQSSARGVEDIGSPLWVGILAAVVRGVFMQGFPEELVMRGWLMQVLRDRPLVAVAVSTIIFGVLHYFSSGGQESAGERVLYLLNPTAFGFCAAAFVLLTRSIWPAVGIHAGMHLAHLAGALMGVAFESPTIWITSAIGYAVAGVVVLVLWHRRGGSTEVVIDR
jgi:membrane protease YdiL (CAAX protease family)